MVKIRKIKCSLYQKSALSSLLFIIIFLLPSICLSHGHSNENPSFKYSREASEKPVLYEKHGHSHDHNGNHKHFYKHNVQYRHTHDSTRNDHYSNIRKADMSEIWLNSMGSTLIISAAPFLILFLIPLDNSDEMRPRLKVLLAFASGGLLGDAFLHLIPHAANPHNGHDHSINYLNNNGHSHSHDHRKDIVIGLWVLGGIIVFLTVEKLVRLLKGEESLSHGHSHAGIKKLPLEKMKKENGDKKKAKTYMKTSRNYINKNEIVEVSGYLNLAADFAHNLTDGLAIGASFLVGNSVGLVTTITILLHEVPHEIGDFAILIKSGCSRRKAMLLQLVTALGALTGNGLALIGVGTDADAAQWVLPFTAGGFIYIATVSVLPELLEESTKLGQSIKEIAALLTGVALMVFIANLE